jgi:hypothetical protein
VAFHGKFHLPLRVAMSLRETCDLNFFYFQIDRREHFITLGMLAFYSDCRDGRVDNAQALRACGPVGPRGFESYSRRQTLLMLFTIGLSLTFFGSLWVLNHNCCFIMLFSMETK